MSPTAQRAQLDFVRLAAAEPSSLYFEQFLRDGFAAWPASYQRRFPGLMSWPGIAGMKRSLQCLVGAPAEGSVLFASRSLILVKLAARSMFRVCRHVLTTDLSWPTYQSALEQRARQTEARITVTPLRDQILHEHWTTTDVANHLAEAFADQGGDGLFLPIVDHLGIRLPIREIVTSIRSRGRLQYCLLDAAQAFCQVPIDDCFEHADVVVAGSHKWLGAYLPTGIAFVHNPAGRRFRTARSQDPLLRFTQQLAGDFPEGPVETANIASLFACGGAIHDQRLRLHGEEPESMPEALQNRSLPFLPRWQPVSPDPAFQSRMVLFQALDPATCHIPVDEIRRLWLNAGAIITAYPGGLVRTSWPWPDWSAPRRTTATSERLAARLTPQPPLPIPG